MEKSFVGRRTAEAAIHKAVRHHSITRSYTSIAQNVLESNRINIKMIILIYWTIPIYNSNCERKNYFPNLISMEIFAVPHIASLATTLTSDTNTLAAKW
jgi:hypothetical protein